MSDSPSSSETVVAGYQQRLLGLDSHLAELTRKSRQLSWARGTVFTVALLLGLAGWLLFLPRVPSWFAAGFTFVGFVAVIGYHEFIEERLRTQIIRRELQAHQLARYLRRWIDVPHPQVEPPSAFRATAADLDLFSEGGVFQWACRAHTPYGLDLLRNWISCPAAPEEITARQAAVRRLAQDRQLRDRLDLHGRLLAASKAGPEALIAWAEGARWSAGRRWIQWLTTISSIAMLLLIVSIVGGFVSADWNLLFLGLLAVHVLANGLFVGSVHDLFNTITAGNNELTHYAALFEIVDGLPTDTPRLAELRSQMQVAGGFAASLRKLKRIMKLANGRRSSVFGVPYVFVQILFFWDFHVLRWLEAWQARYGNSVRPWLQAVGQLEALSSLASVAADHPQWAYPTVTVGAEIYRSTGLGHPLLHPDDCRHNDVQLGPPGTFLLVTGSNMSGKSTLLRALGVNAVLAQAGAPVCASSLEMPVVELASSMRVTDSLSDGVSFFLAELKRLKEIVDQARNMPADTDRRLLFLLDEILQGTNSAERHIAVARVIEHLVNLPTLGAVSTHDLELAAEPSLVGRCQTVHFREQFESDGSQKSMSFDYRLRDGVSPTTNALKLLELVGLDEAE